MRSSFDWSGSSSQRREQGVCLPPQPNDGPELAKYRPKVYGKNGHGGKGKRRRSSWFDAIQNAGSHAELSAVARTLSVILAAGKLSEYQFAKLVELGQQRRQALARRTKQ